MKGWQKEIMRSVKDRLEKVGLEYHDDYFLKTFDDEVWGGIGLIVSSSSRHLTLVPFASLQCPRIWRLSKTFEPNLEVSNWQWLHRRDFSNGNHEKKIKVDVINFSFWVDSSPEEVTSNLEKLCQVTEGVISSYIEPRLSLNSLVEAEKPLLMDIGPTQYANPILFMEVDRPDLAAKTIELQRNRDQLSESYVRKFQKHYAERLL